MSVKQETVAGATLAAAGAGLVAAAAGLAYLVNAGAKRVGIRRKPANRFVAPLR